MMSSERIRRTPLKSPARRRSNAREDTTHPDAESQAHQALTAEHMTPDNVIALQRTVGNQATQRLLAARQTAEGSVLQAKLVPPGRVKKTGESFINTFKFSRSAAYDKAQEAGISDTDIANLFQALLDSDDEYTYMDMEKIVETQIENQAADTPQSSREMAYGGVTVTQTGQSFTVQTGQTTTNEGQVQKIHSKWILIDINFLIESPDEHVEDWELGFIQTVTSSDRDILLTDTANRTKLKKLQLPGPRRDGGSDTLMPWFQTASVASFGKQKVQAARVQFEDRPGFGVTLNPGEQLNRMNGTDTFKLVLALRKKDGTDISILHTWQWRADYDTLAGDGALGITVDADAPGGDPSNLVMDGTRARHDFTTTDRYLTTAEAQVAGGAPLPDLTAFKEMKSRAKKKSTPGSGMLPVKSYGKLVTKYNQHVHNNDWAQAKTIIDELRQKLDLMNNKGTEYWRSNQVKTKYFDPIYNAIQQQQTFINDKVNG